MHVFLRLALITVLAYMSSGCVSDKLNYEEGIASFKCQDYRRAFIRLLPEAIKGKPDAQYAVGYMYYYGQGVTEDRQKAWTWIATAGKAGQVDAVEAMIILRKQFDPNLAGPHYKTPQVPLD